MFDSVILGATANAGFDGKSGRGAFNNGSFEQDYTQWQATGNQEIVTAPAYLVTDGRKAVLFNAGQTEPNAVLSQTFSTTGRTSGNSASGASGLFGSGGFGGSGSGFGGGRGGGGFGGGGPGGGPP